MDVKERLKYIQTVAEEQGEYLKQRFLSPNNPEDSIKLDGSLVTPEDEKVERSIVQKIRMQYPQDSILGEEKDEFKGNSGIEWIIDPIDGTSNFIYNLPIFTTSVGIMNNKKFIGGLIHIPLENKTYIATTDEIIQSPNPCRVSERVKNINTAMTIFSIAHKNHLREINIQLYPIIFSAVRKVRIIGSISYEMMLLATGGVDAVVNVGSELWDLAGVANLAKNAGVEMVDFEGNPWTPESPNIIATNGSLVNQFVDIIQKGLHSVQA